MPLSKSSQPTYTAINQSQSERADERTSFGPPNQERLLDRSRRCNQRVYGRLLLDSQQLSHGGEHKSRSRRPAHP